MSNELMLQSDVQELEFWLPVKNYEGLYEVSTLGRFKMLERERTLGKVKYIQPEKITVGNDDHRGYLKVTMSDKNQAQTLKIQHIVLLTFVGPPPGAIGSKRGMWTCNHIDGNTYNNRLENLEWMLHEDNLALRKMNQAHVDRVKLSDDDIREIRRLAETDMTQQKIAEQFNCNTRYVQMIVTRRARPNVV